MPAAPSLCDLASHAAAIVSAIRVGTEPGALVAAQLGAHGKVAGRGAAVGKASIAMAASVCEAAGGWRGPIVAPHGTSVPRDGQELGRQVLLAGHPLPDDHSRLAGARVSDSLRPRGAAGGTHESLTVLLSGGASALMVDPPPEIPIEDYREVVRALLRAGAPIQEVNAVRKHIDRLKGGGLARVAGKARLDVLVLSDVIGDDLSVIGSGPFSPDPTTYADALQVLQRRACLDKSPAVSEWLRQGASGRRPETPKPGDPVFDRVRHVVIGNNRTAVDAAAIAARGLGFEVETRAGVTGEAAQIGRELAAALRARAAPARGPIALVWGGETTVTVGSAAGVGGRNQELALAAAVEVAGCDSVAVLTYSTDGVDGPTDAAGALVTGETIEAGRRHGLDAALALARHDSHTYLDRLGSLLRTGPTGTNVNDVAVALAY